jgi:hypothetical protein
MEPQEKHIKKWWAAIPNVVLLQLLSELVQARRASEKWTKCMAHISLKLDFDAQEQVSILAYRNQWGWSHHKVANFIKNSGLDLVKIEEKNNRSLSILKSTRSRHITDSKPTTNRHVKVIDFEDLERETDAKPTLNRHQSDRKPATPNYKLDLYLEQQLAGLLQNLDAGSQGYVLNELRRMKPANPVDYAKAIIIRLIKENGGENGKNNEGYGDAGNEYDADYSRLAELEEQARLEAEEEAAGTGGP